MKISQEVHSIFSPQAIMKLNYLEQCDALLVREQFHFIDIFSVCYEETA